MNVRPMRPKFATLAVRSVDVSDVCGCEHAGDSIMFRDAPRCVISVGSTIIKREQKGDFAIYVRFKMKLR